MVPDLSDGVTVGDLLHPCWGHMDERYSLYLVRDVEFIIYVGQTTMGVARRLQLHLEGGGWPPEPSNLGQLILDNVPDSHAWTVNVWELHECDPLVSQHLPRIASIGARFDRFGSRLSGKSDLDLAELALMREYKPALNGTGNPFKRPLPPKYRRSPR